MDSDTQEGKPSRRKVLQRQNKEIKDLKEEWKKVVASSKQKGSKKELEKKYHSKMESLQLLHKMELLRLSGEEGVEREEDSSKPSTGGEDAPGGANASAEAGVSNGFQTPGELPSLYSNASFQMTRSEKRKKKKQKEQEQRYMKALEECSLNSKLNTENASLKLQEMQTPSLKNR